MGRKTIAWTVGLACGALALWGATELRRAQDAERLRHEAELALIGALPRVGELPELEAARAAMLLERALELGDDAEIGGWLAHARAVSDFQRGRPERAAAHLAEARKALGEHPDRLVLEAALARDAGDRERAERAIERALNRWPDHGRARVLAVDLALDDHDPRTALQGVQALLDDAGELARLLNRRGLAREALGDGDGAIEDFFRAAERDPSLHQPLINVGRLQRDAGNLREAEDAFGRAIARSDAAGEAWLGRGLSRIALSDLKGGELDLKRARELMPDAPGPLLALADVDARRGDLQRAEDRYRAVLLMAPDDAVAWLKLGNTLMRQRQPERARDAYRRAVALSPNMAAAHNGLGAARMELGDSAGAADALARASSLDANDPNPLLNLARLRRSQGDAQGAAQAEQAALALR